MVNAYANSWDLNWYNERQISYFLSRCILNIEYIRNKDRVRTLERERFTGRIWSKSLKDHFLEFFSVKLALFTEKKDDIIFSLNVIFSEKSGKT